MVQQLILQLSIHAKMQKLIDIRKALKLADGAGPGADLAPRAGGKLPDGGKGPKTGAVAAGGAKKPAADPNAANEGRRSRSSINPVIRPTARVISMALIPSCAKLSWA